MNDKEAASYMAKVLIMLTDPKMPRWAKDQLKAQGRVKAKQYLAKTKEGK